MRLAYAFLADAAQYTADGRLWILGGDIDTLFVPAIPAIHPTLTLVFKIKIPPSEVKEQYHISLRFVDPDGDEFQDRAEFAVKSRESEFALPQKERGINMPIVIQGLKFEKSGEYHLQIFVDDIELETIPLHIVIRGASESVDDSGEEQAEQK